MGLQQSPGGARLRHPRSPCRRSGGQGHHQALLRPGAGVLLSCGLFRRWEAGNGPGESLSLELRRHSRPGARERNGRGRDDPVERPGIVRRGRPAAVHTRRSGRAARGGHCRLRCGRWPRGWDHRWRSAHLPIRSGRPRLRVGADIGLSIAGPGGGGQEKVHRASDIDRREAQQILPVLSCLARFGEGQLLLDGSRVKDLVGGGSRGSTRIRDRAGRRPTSIGTTITSAWGFQMRW